MCVCVYAQMAGGKKKSDNDNNNKQEQEQQQQQPCLYRRQSIEISAE